MSSLRAVLAFVTALALSSVADANPTTPINPPPAEKFSNFQAFFMSPIETPQAKSPRDQRNNTKNAQRIENVINQKIAAQLKTWTTDPQSRTLLIQPRILEIRLSGMFSPGFVADSRVTMRVKFIDRDTGKIIAEPEFYQHANQWGAAWSYGGAQKAMLTRIGTLVAKYIAENYQNAVGGEATNEVDDKESVETENSVKPE